MVGRPRRSIGRKPCCHRSHRWPCGDLVSSRCLRQSAPRRPDGEWEPQAGKRVDLKKSLDNCTVQNAFGKADCLTDTAERPQLSIYLAVCFEHFVNPCGTNLVFQT